MQEGDIVMVVGKLDSRIRYKNQDKEIFGTFIGFVSDKRVVVLLDNGDLFLGYEYEIIKAN